MTLSPPHFIAFQLRNCGASRRTKFSSSNS
jgi:hypothetical protein